MGGGRVQVRGAGASLTSNPRWALRTERQAGGSDEQTHPALPDAALDAYLADRWPDSPEV